MSLKVKSGQLPAQIELPCSKSHANRYLILCSRLGDREIRSLPQSEDVMHLLAALKAVGVEIVTTPQGVVFKNHFPACEHGPVTIQVGEGGTTARFLAALLATGKERYQLQLAGRLAERPWDELLETLTKMGAKAALTGNVLEIQGPVDWNRMPNTIDVSRSTQFASAIQLAGAADGLKVSPAHLESSKTYWALTVAACGEVANQKTITVPKDWSSASYPLAFAAVTGQKVFLPNLAPDPLQADSVLGEWLLERGALRVTESGIEAAALEDLSSVTMDMSHCLDLTPAMTFICAHLQGVSKLTGLKSLRHKESDRLKALDELLTSCGIQVSTDEDSLTIQGGEMAIPATLHPPADHRLVMTAALFLAKNGGGEIENDLAVAKSFPGFFNLMGF